MKTCIIRDTTEDFKTQYIDRERPTPGSNEVLIKWHATSLNYHDYLVAKGLIKTYNNRIPMSDGAGEIVALGEGVSEWKIGDKVMSMFFPGWQDGQAELIKIAGVSGETIDGYLSEYSALPEIFITRIPKEYSYAEAATLPCAALTAWNGLFGARQLQSGESVLIEGTGGMSMFGLQFALAKGADVYATSSSPDKIERLKSLGCKEVVNYREDPLWGKTIFKKSDGGVDFILDVGGGSTMKQSIEASKIGGHIISIGILSNGRKGEITFPKLFFKFTTIRGIAVGSKAMQNDMVEFIDEHQIKPIIDSSFAFDEIEDAFRHQESGKHFGKIVLEW